MNKNKNSLTGDQYPPARRCAVVLPGLLDIPRSEHESAYAQIGHLPELEWFFSRAQRQSFPGANLDATLFALFNAELPTDVDMPVAAVAYVGDTDEQVGDWCLRADPVQLIPDRDQLVLLGPEGLRLSQAEADQLVLELNVQFAQDDWRIEACTPTHWYLHQTDVPKLRTYNLSQVRGHAIGDYLPKGKEAKQWHRLMNEIQMVLHASVVNQERQASGQPAVTSLWFWGGGKTPDIAHGRWSKLWSNESVSRGLASLSSTPRKNLPENAKEWLDTAISPGEHLIVLDELSNSWQNEDVSDWIHKVGTINREWLAPLLSALRSKKIDELTLYACNGNRFSLSGSSFRHWWRRKKTLSAIAGQV